MKTKIGRNDWLWTLTLNLARPFAVAGVLCSAAAGRGQSLAPEQVQLQQEQRAILALPEHPASQAPPVGDYLTFQNIESWPFLPADTLNLPFWIIGHVKWTPEFGQ